MNNRLDEINKIINELIPNNYINNIIDKYNIELDNYKYIDNIIEFSLLPLRGSIRYINKYDLKLRYGGLLIKLYEKKNTWYAIIKKNNNKKYNILFNNNYIFYRDTNSNKLINWGKCFISDIELGKYIIN